MSAALCRRAEIASTEEDETDTRASSSEDDERTQLEECRAQLRAVQARLAQAHEENEAQRRLSSASLRTVQKRLTVALGHRRRARSSAPLASACADTLDALEALSVQLDPVAAAKIQSDFRRSCLLVLHPDKTKESSRDERNLACLHALQEEWKRRRMPDK